MGFHSSESSQLDPAHCRKGEHTVRLRRVGRNLTREVSGSRIFFLQTGCNPLKSPDSKK
jgi:hypothetical protein